MTAEHVRGGWKRAARFARHLLPAPIRRCMVDRVGQEERRCLARLCHDSRCYLVEDGNDHPRLRNGENGGLFACHDPARRQGEESPCCRCSRLSTSSSRPRTIRVENMLLVSCRLTIRVTPTNLRAIEHFAAPFCERFDVIRIRESFELTSDKWGCKILPRLASLHWKINVEKFLTLIATIIFHLLFRNHLFQLLLLFSKLKII